jgi:protein-S-isoprenylcysteine O-methyltransferase Ste14
MFAFIWTYPIMNNILAAYMISLRWDSDYKLMQMPTSMEMYRNFRRMINSFVGIVVILLSCLYLVYMVSLPTDLNDEMDKLFKFIAIFNFIIGFIIALMGAVYVKKMWEDVSHNYAKAVAVEATIWIIAQFGSGGFCYWLGSGGAKTLI